MIGFIRLWTEKKISTTDAVVLNLTIAKEYQGPKLSSFLMQKVIKQVPKIDTFSLLSG